MEAGELCIQSFAPHSVEFVDKTLASVGVEKAFFTIPAGSEKNNYVIAKQELINELMKDATFKSMLENKVIRILPELPAKYENPVQTLNAVRSNLVETTSALREEKEKVSALSSENEILKARIAELENGGKIEDKKDEGGA